MFTTITNLRNSTAQQSRVSTVENWLKRQNPGYTPDSLFPIYLIANSNVIADVEWVLHHSTTHAEWPEFEKLVLAEFGHQNEREHFDYLEARLNERTGKAKAVAEFDEKYKAAHAKLNPTHVTPANIGGNSEITNGFPENETATQEQADNDNNATADETITAADVAPAVSTPDYALEGAFYIAIGKIIASKGRSFQDACRYSLSPTGSRLYSQYVMENGADGKAAREFLKIQVNTFTLL